MRYDMRKEKKDVVERNEFCSFITGIDVAGRRKYVFQNILRMYVDMAERNSY